MLGFAREFEFNVCDRHRPAQVPKRYDRQGFGAPNARSAGIMAIARRSSLIPNKERVLFSR
jgi:hypothetical protein